MLGFPCGRNRVEGGTRGGLQKRGKKFDIFHLMVAAVCTRAVCECVSALGRGFKRQAEG